MRPRIRDQRELLLVMAVAVHLLCLPLSLGSMRLPAQLCSLALALTAFGLAVIPRTVKAEDGNIFRVSPHRRLLRAPLFWGGLLFVLLVVCQALNPRWVYSTDGRSWWLTHVEAVKWLPQGITAPFERMNAWRFLIIVGSTWLSAMAVWGGLHRRRSVVSLLFVVGASGVVQALLGLAQQLAHTDKIFWYFTPANEGFFGSFHYKNHAGAYIILCCGVLLALGAWFQRRQEAKMHRSGSAPVFYFFGAVLFVATVLSRARAATLVLACFLVLLLAGSLWWLRSVKGNRWAVTSLVAVFAVGSLLGLTQLDTRGVQQAFGELRRDNPGYVTVDRRIEASRATWEMFKDSWVTGWGGGCFRYYFPVYQQHRPLIWKDGKTRLIWEFAHNDILQILAEVGVVGVLFIFVSIGAGLKRLMLIALRKTHGAITILALSCLMTVGYAWMDFPLSNPAVLITCAIVFWLAVRWGELEQAGDAV